MTPYIFISQEKLATGRLAVLLLSFYYRCHNNITIVTAVGLIHDSPRPRVYTLILSAQIQKAVSAYKQADTDLALQSSRPL